MYLRYIYPLSKGSKRGVQIKPVEVGPRNVDLAPDDARGRREHLQTGGIFSVRYPLFQVTTFWFNGLTLFNGILTAIFTPRLAKI